MSGIFILLQITTARKAVTLLLSYLIFTKPLTEQHCSGLILIAMGIILKMLPENKVPARLPTSSASSKQGKAFIKEAKKGSSESKEGKVDEERRPLV